MLHASPGLLQPEVLASGAAAGPRAATQPSLLVEPRTGEGDASAPPRLRPPTPVDGCVQGPSQGPSAITAKSEKRVAAGAGSPAGRVRGGGCFLLLPHREAREGQVCVVRKRLEKFTEGG